MIYFVTGIIIKIQKAHQLTGLLIKPKQTFTLLILLGLSASLYSQQSVIPELITSLAEELAEENPEEIELYTEKLYDLSADPVELNSADKEEIGRLFFLSDFQLKSLSDYLSSSGPVYSVFEIAVIPGFNRETAEIMSPFVIISRKSRSYDSMAQFRSTLVTSITHSTASINSDSEASPLKMQARYKFRAGSFAGGVTAEKDPGEKLFAGNPPAPDFLSGHLQYSGKGFVRRFVIGDYTARFGEGLCLNTGWQSGLYLTSQGYWSSNTDVRGYTSVDENRFLRGTAASFGHGRLTGTMFYSVNRIDATLNETDNAVSSLDASGTHITPQQLRKKDALTDKAYGINLNYAFDKVNAGFSYTEDRFSIPFEPQNDDPEKIFDLSGKESSLWSVNYKTIFDRIQLFGEITFSNPSVYGLVQGGSIRLSDRLTINALYREYRNGFYSFHGHGPAGNTQNEKSMLSNFTFEAASHLFVSAGCDLRNYSWLRYRISAPSQALREEVRIKYLPRESFSFEAIYNHRISSIDQVESVGIILQQQSISDHARVSFKYAPDENMSFTTRIDYKHVRPKGESGTMILQDIRWSLTGVPLTFWFRYCVFNTGGWDSRLYAYENDILYSFSMPALSGAGSRSYLMVRYLFRDFAELRFRYGLTSLNDGDGKEDVRFQIKFNF